MSSPAYNTILNPLLPCDVNRHCTELSAPHPVGTELTKADSVIYAGNSVYRRDLAHLGEIPTYCQVESYNISTFRNCLNQLSTISI